jgi:hypothetical protein
MSSQMTDSNKQATSKVDGKSAIPYRQIRAVYDEETITVYQAYSDSIATAAVETQRLCASKDFSFDRFTWVKPSWCWMMFVVLLDFTDCIHGRNSDTD